MAGLRDQEQARCHCAGRVGVYVANWCSCWLFLRVPKVTLDTRTLKAFGTEFAFTVDRTNTHWILEWALNESENYDRFGEEDGRGWMGRLTPLRDELLRGDLRPLYLGWLAGVSAREVDEEAIEPPRPPGLSRLTAAQQSLAEFLEINPDLLRAVEIPDQQTPDFDTKGDGDLDAWIAELPTSEKGATLKLLLTGHAQQAERRLKLRFLAWQREQQPIGRPGPPRRTVAELRKLAASAAETRKKAGSGAVSQTIPTLDLPLPKPRPKGSRMDRCLSALARDLSGVRVGIHAAHDGTVDGVPCFVHDRLVGRGPGVDHG